MKKKLQMINLGGCPVVGWGVALVLSLWAVGSTQAIQPKIVAPPTSADVETDTGLSKADPAPGDEAAKAESDGEKVVIQQIEPVAENEHAPRKKVPWLGVSTEEASEALSSQLGLDSGVGLVITYVA